MYTTVAIWITYGLWVALVVYVTLTAIGTKADTQTHLGQSLLLLFALVAAFVLPHLPPFGFVNFAPVNPLVTTIGLVVTVAGDVVFVAGRQALGRNWSQTVSAKDDPELVESGPYRYIRHPMYSGGLIAAAGSVLVAAGPFVFLLVFLAPVFLWRVRAEDRLLERQFPTAYPEYERRTKALIPFVW